MKTRNHFFRAILILSGLGLNQCKQDRTNAFPPYSKKIAPPGEVASRTPVPPEPQATHLGDSKQAEQVRDDNPSGNIKKVMEKRFGMNAVHAKMELDSFLKNWNPIGKKAEELISALGKPDVETKNVVTYRFDSGGGGWQFDFNLKEGRIASVVPRGMD